MRVTSGWFRVFLVLTVGLILAGPVKTWISEKFRHFPRTMPETEGKIGLNGLFLSVQVYKQHYRTFPKTHNGVDAKTAGVGFAVNGRKQKFDYFISSNPRGWAGGAVSRKPLGSSEYFTLFRINTHKWLCAPFDTWTEKPADVAMSYGSDTGNRCPESSDGKRRTWRPTFIPAADDWQAF